MSAWTDYATKVFREGQKKNPAYKFKDALKDAKKVYKSGETYVSETVSEVREKISRKTQKKRRTGKDRRRKTSANRKRS